MWAAAITGLVSILTSFFKGEGVSRAAGAGNGIIFYGAIVGGSILLERFRKMTPPSV